MPGQRRPATTVVALAVLTLALLGLTAWPFSATAVAAPGMPPEPPAPAVPSQPTGPGLELRIDAMNPRVVTSTGPAILTITGDLVNTGDQPVHNVEIRAQRGDRLRTEGELRTALASNADDAAVTPAFADVVAELGPGQRHPVRLSIPLRGSTTNSLALQRTGVYELLLNVNGAPEDGNQARLAGIRMLLPVLGLPAATGRPPEPSNDAAATTPVTVLYPLADQPRRLPTGPGEPVLLADDQLATSLAQGGRLDGLVGALETAAPAGSPVRHSICLAVDPDLLRTVSDMSGGYEVRGPDGTTTNGRGTQVAGQWLDRLRALAAGSCVVALPYADADLVALSRAGLDDLAQYATRDGAQIASEVLRTPVRADITWPADGLLDERSLTGYVSNGGRAVVLSADAVAVTGRSGRGTTGGVVRLPGSAATVSGLLADPLVTLAAEGDELSTVSGTAFSSDVGTGQAGQRRFGALTGNTEVSPAGTGATLSAQDAIGAVAFRALNPTSGSTSPAAQTPLLVAPPHRWNTTGGDARELLGSLSTLITEGRLTPNPLLKASAMTSGSATPPGATGGSTLPSSAPPIASLVYPLRAGAREVPGTVTGQLRTDRNVANELRASAESNPGVGATPAQVFDPVTEGLLRSASAAWRGRPELADQATKVITDRIQLLRSLVRVLEPPTPYSLGDEEAPLPITLANGLPVEMRVRVVLSDTPGLRTDKISEVRIPPMGRLQLRVNAQLTRSGQFSVEARLTTLNGVPLGVPSRLLLRSTAYGTITLWLTGTAGLLLVILAVRRIARRLRGNGPRRHGENAVAANGPAPKTNPDPAAPVTPGTERPTTAPGPTPPGTDRRPDPSRDKTVRHPSHPTPVSSSRPTGLPNAPTVPRRAVPTPPGSRPPANLPVPPIVPSGPSRPSNSPDSAPTVPSRPAPPAGLPPQVPGGPPAPETSPTASRIPPNVPRRPSR